MSNNNISFVFQSDCIYPEKKDKFRPSKIYPEYFWENSDISKKTNQTYDSVRESFHIQGWDNKNYGTAAWNPLGVFITPGNQVLIKPNLVMDVNKNNQGTDCLYTNPAVVAAVIDYVVIALNGQGKIIVGDAPMQECDFDNLYNTSGYKELVEFYKEKGIQIEMIDFRELTSVVKGGVHQQSINKRNVGTVIDLGDKSLHAQMDSDVIDRYRITNYDPRILNSHHTGSKHEYYISNILLESDVIINMPKPKTHRKAGATMSLKNFVGVNVRKEYLPHHTQGSVQNDGDEYNKTDSVHELRSKLLDRMNILISERKYSKAKVICCLIRVCSLILRIKKHEYSEGSWYGNNTISKTIVDINRLVFFADKKGVLKENTQRKVIIVGDMIISGEKEGPIAPSPKKVGLIVTGTEPLAYDIAVSTIMGFDYKKIPTLKCAIELFDKVTPNCIKVVSNDTKYDGLTLDKIDYNLLFDFEPTHGWKNYIELKR